MNPQPQGPLVEPAWLQAQSVPPVRVLDVRKREEYDAGHIPGAIHLDIFDLHWADTSEEGIAGFRKLHEEAFGGIGISPADIVVVYENTSSMLAARTYWVLELFGQHAVFMLNGGLNAWNDAGYPVSTEPVTLPAVEYTSGWNPDIIADYDKTRDSIGLDNTVILDTRTDDEFLGRRVRAKFGGAIPGALHLEYVRNIGEDGRFKSPEALAALYRERDVTPDKEVILYCQGAYRAANSYLALKLAGYPRVRNYLGSWGEWGNRDDAPREQPPEERV